MNHGLISELNGPPTDLSGQDVEDLRYAKTLLESPGLAVKLTSIVGSPLEKSLSLLPAGLKRSLEKVSLYALRIALRFALLTLKNRDRNASNGWHKGFVGASGGLVINTLFMDHYQKMARGHFVIRRLERIYGGQMVKEAYDATKLA